MIKCTSIEWFHRSSLSLKSRRIYDRLAKTLVNRTASCRLDGSCSAEDIKQVFEWILCDEPSVFSVDSLRVEVCGSATYIWPNYMLRYDEYARVLSLCAKSAESILKNCDGNSDYAIALAAHDEMMRRFRYVDDGTRSVHSILAPLTKGYGVCEGFSKTFQYLLQMKSIPCIPVYGTLRQRGSTLEKHVWNLACLDGQWTHIDVTRDMALSGDCAPRHDYFAVSSKGIAGEHRFDADAYPCAVSEDLDYYTAFGFVMNTKSELAKHICDRIGVGDRSFVFKLPDNVPQTGIIEKVSHVAEEALHRMRFCGSYEMQYNLDRKVFNMIVRES